MNKLVIVAAVFLVTCLIEVDTDFADSIFNIPGQVGDALTTYWNRVVTNIRKPVQVRRLGGRRRRRRLKKKNATTISPFETTTFSSPSQNFAPAQLEPVLVSSPASNRNNLISNSTRISASRLPGGPFPGLRNKAQTETPISSTSIPTMMTESSPSYIISSIRTLTVSDQQKINLPVFMRPQWRNLEEWSELQKPRFISRRRGERADGFPDGP